MRLRLQLLLWIASTTLLTACQHSSESRPEVVAPSAGKAEHGEEAAHSHAEEGPHGGHVVVLGDEAYHAEWLHDDASGQVTVFLLAADGKTDVRTTADALRIEVAIAGAARQHALAAADRDQSVPATASRFEILDKPLVEALKAAGQGVDATIVVEIAGATYRGAIEHHEHGDAHGHAH